MLENLEVLGRVWGYVKYHHPAFSSDKYDLDFELFELLPQVAAAEPAVRNRILVSWIDGFGKFKTAPKIYDSILASDSLHEYSTDISWIRDTARLGIELSERLIQLRIADRKKGNHYVSSTVRHIDGVKYEAGNSCFNNEKAYTQLSDPDYGYRLLSVFRFWNMIEYFFPTKHLTDKNWNEVLPEYIDRMVHPIDGDYRKETWRMIAEINDNHAQGDYIWLFGAYRVPLHTGFVEDRLIVMSPDTAPICYDRKATFEVGDEIISVNRLPLDYYMSQVREFVPCSNKNDILAATADIILRSKTNRPYWISYIRNGIRRDTLLPGMIQMERKFETIYLDRNIETDKMLDDSIGYIFSGKYNENDSERMNAVLLRSKGLVIDLRCYPTFDFRNFIGRHFIPDGTKKPFTFSYPVHTLPGVFYTTSYSWPALKGEKYTGPIVVLVNANTQSYAETCVQWLQSNPNVEVIGAQSAGANGDISTFTLPGNISSRFSGLGWYYPDGCCVQRQGVKIDCEVQPTIEGIKAARDEMKEAAIHIIETENRGTRKSGKE